jgi:hypothetical protein
MVKKIVQIVSFQAFAMSLAVSKAFGQFDVEPVGPDATPFPNLGSLIRNILSLIFFIAGLLAFIYLLIGGIQWITSGGDKAAASAARDRITAALVGLIIIVAAFAITLVLEQVFGLRILTGVNFQDAPNVVND